MLTDTRMEYLTADELALYLRTSRKTIYNMHENHKIPGAVKIGAKLLFNKRMIDEWLDSLRNKELDKELLEAAKGK